MSSSSFHGLKSKSQIRHTKKMVPTRKVSRPPRSPMTAYQIYVKMAFQAYFKLPGAAPRSLVEFSQEYHQHWLSLPEQEKARFEKEAEMDEDRYRRELWENDHPVAANPIDPNCPKRPLSGYMRYCNEERASLKKAHPEYVMPEITKELGRRWRQLDAKTRARYEIAAQQARVQYHQELNEYLKSQYLKTLTKRGANGAWMTWVK